MEQPNIFTSYLRVIQHISQQFRSHLDRLDLTFPQAPASTVLGEDGPVPISALAKRTGSASNTVSGIVDRLEKLELARRQRNGTDRWVIYVYATEKCNALRAKTATDVSGYSSSLLSGMSQEDRAMIAVAFQKLDDASLQAGTEQPGPRQNGQETAKLLRRGRVNAAKRGGAGEAQRI